MVEIQSTGNHGEDHILQWAIEAYEATMRRHEENWCVNAYTYYQYWRNFVEAGIDPDDYHSNVGLGLAYPIIKTMSAMMQSPWQAGDQIVEAKARHEMGRQRAPMVSAFVNDKMVNQIPQMFTKTEMCVEAGFGVGRGVLKPHIRFHPPHRKLQRVLTFLQQITQVVMGQGAIGSQLGFHDVPAEQRFDVGYVDPFNWWYEGSSFRDCDFTVERQFITHSEAWRRHESKEWRHGTMPDKGDAVGWDQYSIKRRNLETAPPYGQVRTSLSSGSPHELVEIQGWVETKERDTSREKYELRLVQVLNRKTLVKNELLATWNARPGYIVFEPFPDFANATTSGVIEPIEHILLAMNDLFNIAFDNAKKIVESPLMVDPMMLANGQKTLFLGPAEINWIRNPRYAVAPLELKDLPKSFYELIGFMSDLIQRNSGVSDYFGGLNTADTERLTKTAKGMELMANMATRRFSPVLKKVDLELYRPLAEAIHQTARLRMGHKDVIRLPGNPESPFMEVSYEDMDVLLDWTFNTKALDQTTGKRRQEFIEMVGLIGELAQTGTLGQQGYYLDAYEIARVLMDEFGRGHEVERLVKRIADVAGQTQPMLPFGAGPAGSVPGIPGGPVAAIGERFPSNISRAA